jgi:hypothetical protein
MPDINKDFEFMMAILKTGTLTVNYDAAGAMLGWNKKKCVNKMSEFRRSSFSPSNSLEEVASMLKRTLWQTGKAHDWPINKDAAAAAPKAAKAKASKRAAAGDGKVKKPAAKRTKTKKPVKEEEVEDEAEAEAEAVGDEEAEEDLSSHSPFSR